MAMGEQPIFEAMRRMETLSYPSRAKRSRAASRIWSRRGACERRAFPRGTPVARWVVIGKIALLRVCLHRTHMDVKKKLWIHALISIEWTVKSVDGCLNASSES